MFRRALIFLGVYSLGFSTIPICLTMQVHAEDPKVLVTVSPTAPSDQKLNTDILEVRLRKLGEEFARELVLFGHLSEVSPGAMNHAQYINEMQEGAQRLEGIAKEASCLFQENRKNVDATDPVKFICNGLIGLGTGLFTLSFIPSVHAEVYWPALAIIGGFVAGASAISQAFNYIDREDDKSHNRRALDAFLNPIRALPISRRFQVELHSFDGTGNPAWAANAMAYEARSHVHCEKLLTLDDPRL